MGKITSRVAFLLLGLLPGCAILRGAEAPGDEAARERTFAAGLRALDASSFADAGERLATVAAICPVDRLGRRAMLLLAAAEIDPRNAESRPSVAAQLAAFQLVRPSEQEAWVSPLAGEIYTLALDYGADSVARNDLPDSRILWSHYFEGAADTAGGPRAEPLGAAPDDSVARPAAALAGEPAPAPVAPVPTGGPRCDVPRARADVSLPRLARTPVVDRVRVVGERPPAAGQDRAPEVAGDVRSLMAEVDRLEAELAAKEQELDRIRRTLRP